MVVVNRVRSCDGGGDIGEKYAPRRVVFCLYFDPGKIRNNKSDSRNNLQAPADS